MSARLARTAVVVLAAGLVAGACALRESPPDTGDDPRAVTQAACDAIRLRDLAALERLLAPEFTLVGPAGDVQTRAQTLAEVRAGEPQYDVFRNHDMTLHRYGDAAVVQGITSLAGRAGGKPFAVDVRFTDTLVRDRGGRGEWRIVVSHVTRIAAP